MNSKYLSFLSTKLQKWSVFFLLILVLGSQSLSAAIFVVSNTSDSGTGSLRQAIISNNTTPGFNIINFNIPTAPPYVIQPLTPLPSITNPVFIDGYSQPGTSMNTLLQGTNANLLIEINGSNYTVGNGINSGIGLSLRAGSSGSTIRGLVINEWILAGIAILGSSSNNIFGNFIGTNISGTQQDANAIGVLIEATGTAPSSIIPSNNNLIGSGNIADLNLIAGSFSDFLGGSAITLAGFTVNDLPAGVAFNRILGNLIGTDRTGREALGNSINGIALFSSNNTTVSGNLISGQTTYGVNIASSTSSSISGNLIGTDVTGTKALGNQNAGIALSAQSNATTGNLIVGNLISGNGQGISLGSLLYNFGTNFNSIEGNLIGTDITGTKPLGNTENGIWVFDSANFIGSLIAGLGNVISGNGANGVLIASLATSNIVEGNLIGTDITGTMAIGNGENGVQLGLAGGNNASIGNFIGGPIVGQGNVISGNQLNGIKIQSFSSKNIIQGNLIGTDITGIEPLPNVADGVQIVSSFQNLIGGNAITDGNIIAYNRTGVMVGANDDDVETVENAILTNSIFSNITLGIDLHKHGSPQKLEDTFKGPNHFQPSPKISSATISDPVTMIVEGTLHAGVDGTYEIQFFANANSKKGQGAIFLGNLIVTTNGKGKTSFSTSVIPIPEFNFISATATRLDNALNPVETSEFSRSKKAKT